MQTVTSRRAKGTRFCWIGVFASAALFADDSSDARRFWPQWRGPALTGVAPHGNPPVEWTEEKNVRWKLSIPGFGTSTPIVWEDLVFIQTAVRVAGSDESPGGAEGGRRDERRGAAGRSDRPGRRGRGRGRRRRPAPERHRFLLLAVDRKHGEIRWRAVAREEVPHEGHHRDHGYASASPVTDGESVYAYFGSRGLHAFDLAGRRKWEADFGDMRTRRGFGEASSPALHDDTLVINWDHEGDSFIVTVDKRTGKERWRRDRDEPSSWTTPVIVESGNAAQVVVGGSNRTRSYDLESGELLWECGGLTSNVIPTPVSGFGNVYVTSGFRGSALQAIALDGRGDLSGSDAVVWSLGRATPYVPSPLLYDERLYFTSGNRAILSCHDARTGKPLIETFRLEGLDGVYASPVGAAGRIYITGRNGKTVVLADETPSRPLATNALDDRIDASPAIVGGEIYLRGHARLYCIAAEEGASSSPAESN